MKIGNLVQVLNVDLPAARGYQNQIGVIMDLAGDITQDFNDQWDVLVCLVAGETRWIRAEVLTELPREEGLQLARQEWAELRSPDRLADTSISTKRAQEIALRMVECGRLYSYPKDALV
jgi:hypothetical protein